MISSGSKITVERDNDKNPVVALREIAENTVSTGDLKEDLIHSLQKYVEVDEAEPESTLALLVPISGSSILNFIDTIFYGDTGHWLAPTLRFVLKTTARCAESR